MAEKIVTTILMFIWMVLAILTPWVHVKTLDIIFTSLNYFIIVSWILTWLLSLRQERKIKKELNKNKLED